MSGGVYSKSKQDNGQFYYEFIEPALKQIWGWDLSENVTWFIATAGWNQKDIANFHDAVKTRGGVSIIMMDNISQLTNYINSKDVENSNLTSARLDDKITAFSAFSHGLYTTDGGTIEYGYGFSNASDLSMNKGHIATLKTRAFDNAVSLIASCNPGTTYENSFAQAWADKTAGFVGTAYAYVGQSYYGSINDGSRNPFMKLSHRFIQPYAGGSRNYPVAATNKTAAGESPYLRAFTSSWR